MFPLEIVNNSVTDLSAYSNLPRYIHIHAHAHTHTHTHITILNANGNVTTVLEY